MVENEWDADRQLTTAQAARAIRSQFPGITATKVQPMGSGWDSDAYLVDEQWVFRFPRRREVAEGIGTATKVAAVVAAALSDLGVEVPGPAMLGEPCRDFPYRFSGYRRVPGVAADQLPEDRLDIEGLTRTLGAVLTRLHSITTDKLAHIGLGTETGGPAVSVAEAREAADYLLERESGEVRECVVWLTGQLDVPAQYVGELRFLYYDLCPDHVLVDPRTGRVVGLLDFDDAAFGDPAEDFDVLPSWLGWNATDAVLEAYSMPVDSGFRARLELMSRANSLVWLRDSHLQGTDLDKHRRWVLRAFGRRC